MIRCDLLAAVIASGAPSETWEDMLSSALGLFDAGDIRPARPVQSQPKPSPSGVESVPVILKVKKWYGDEKLFAVVECAGEEIKGNAWQEHGKRLDQFNRGDRLELTIKEKGKYINFEHPRSMVADHEPAHGGAHYEDIPF